MIFWRWSTRLKYAYARHSRMYAGASETCDELIDFTLTQKGWVCDVLPTWISHVLIFMPQREKESARLAFSISIYWVSSVCYLSDANVYVCEPPWNTKRGNSQWSRMAERATGAAQLSSFSALLKMPLCLTRFFKGNCMLSVALVRI